MEKLATDGISGAESWQGEGLYWLGLATQSSLEVCKFPCHMWLLRIEVTKRRDMQSLAICKECIRGKPHKS